MPQQPLSSKGCGLKHEVINGQKCVRIWCDSPSATGFRSSLVELGADVWDTCILAKNDVSIDAYYNIIRDAKHILGRRIIGRGSYEDWINYLKMHYLWDAPVWYVMLIVRFWTCLASTLGAFESGVLVYGIAGRKLSYKRIIRSGFRDRIIAVLITNWHKVIQPHVRKRKESMIFGQLHDVHRWPSIGPSLTQNPSPNPSPACASMNTTLRGSSPPANL